MPDVTDVRKRLSLDGTWLFQYDADGSLTPETIRPQREVLAPMPWQAQCPDLRYKNGIAWYARPFSLDENHAASAAAILHFGAVDYEARVWLNDVYVGRHEGGYLPFQFDVAHLLRPGENELIVRVLDVDDEHDPYPFGEILHGKQSWYGPLSGIWQSVWLELRAQAHIRRLRLTPNCQDGTVAVMAPVTSAATAGYRLLLQAHDPDGQLVGERWVEPSSTAIVRLESPVQRWGLEQPALYSVRAELWRGDRLEDRLQEHCGFRTVAAHNGRIYLNEEPIYLRGALDQGYYPHTIYTPPDLEFLEMQARNAQALGLNCLRSHIKIEDPRYYDVADRLGLLVWAELPSWRRLTPAARRRAEQAFRQMVERDWNHPSIFAWSLVNEDWGTDLAREASHRRWLAQFYQQAKELDPTRLIVDNSPCAPTFHVASDLEDYHHYCVIPDHAPQWEQWLDDFASGAEWAWAADYAEKRRDDLPRIVSEFGQWALPHPENIKEEGAEPWWFENGHSRNDGAVYPHGLRQRFDFWALERVFASFGAFVAAHQEHMARGLSQAISAIRQRPAIGGYVITELTDVHWEANGLLDMQRNQKQHQERLIEMNQDRVVVVRPHRYSVAPGAEITAEIEAFDVTGQGREGHLRWSCRSLGGQLPAPGGSIRLAVPTGARGSEIELVVEWIGPDRQVWAWNSVTLNCPQQAPSRPILHVDEDDALAQALATLGYPQAASAEQAIWVSRQFTPDCRRFVEQGGRLLLIAAYPGQHALPLGRVLAREGSVWQGDWATSFSWLRRTGPFSGIAGRPLLDMSFLPIMPTSVLADLPAPLMREHSWAGLAVGWLHKHVSLLVRMRHGRGHMVVTTFRLNSETLADDPIAQALFTAMITLLTPQSGKTTR